ncbi:MAG: tetratricopeptide repeat protein [Phycisphaerales bacterium]
MQTRTTDGAPGIRNPGEADRLTRAAAESSNPAETESLLRRALAADPYCGPAHNNLGATFLAQGRLYEAAAEFEQAKKLMPGHPDPRMNLAFTFESAGRTEEALAEYAAALEAQADHMPSMQALARLQIRSGRKDAQTPRLLREISLRGETAKWREWAAREALRAAEVH